MQVADDNEYKKLCKSIEDLLFMQFRKQGTKVFIKLFCSIYLFNFC